MIFNKNAASCQIDKPCFTVVVDVEEEFAWDSRFSTSHRTVSGNGNLPAVQALFEKHEVKPAYLIDLPAIRSPEISDCLRQWSRADKCEIGTQLHTWVTPPHREVICLQNTFQRNLPQDLEREKLQQLTRIFQEVFEETPRIFKAGRYGVSEHSGNLLREFGYHVDTSVVPYTDYSSFGGGANFIGLPDQPYWVDEDRQLMELPITRGPVGLLSRFANGPLARVFDSQRSHRLKVQSVLASLKILERISLSPESTQRDDMRRLLRSMHRRGKKVIVIWFHSSSLVREGSPYASTQSDIDRLLTRLEFVLDILGREMGYQPVSVLEMRRRALGQA